MNIRTKITSIIKSILRDAKEEDYARMTKEHIEHSIKCVIAANGRK